MDIKIIIGFMVIVPILFSLKPTKKKKETLGIQLLKL